MPQIFLSYRRNDNPYAADNLSDKLQQHFGKGAVFFDVDTIPLGVDFREHIANAVGKCDVLLAIIGVQWLQAVDKQGNRRLDDPSDFVRIEIESALKRNIPVIPVLINEAEMPSADDLPPSLKDMAFRNAIELSSGRDRHQHLELLIQGLESIFGLKNVSEGKAIPETLPVHESKQAKVSDRTSAPSGVLEEIQEGLAGFTDKTLFVGKIPPKKLNNAIKSFAKEVAPEDVLLLYDDTFFGSAKNGLLLTAEAVYWCNDGFSDAERFRYAELRKVDFTDAVAIVLNEKEITVTMADDKVKLAESVVNVIRRLVSG